MELRVTAVRDDDPCAVGDAREHDLDTEVAELVLIEPDRGLSFNGGK